MKRGRADGHLSKEEVEAQSDVAEQPLALSAAKANALTMQSRRVVTVQRKDKKEKFAKHLLALNQSFFEWLKAQTSANIYADLTDGFQDYVDYATVLEDRYLRKYGEVLTFGSGDCGQLAHGEEPEDLEVKYPRIVYSLRDKKVCGIACGGIHNAVYTEAGQVYTWGCGDDGPLGRPGTEGMPLLVEGLANETIVGVTCGDAQTIAVNTKGEVWGWGCYKDKEGKTWFNPAPDAANPSKDIKKKQLTPLKIAGLTNIVDVACGASFNLAMSADGKVYSWGIGESGELGRFAPPLKKGVGEDAAYDMPSILAHHLTPGAMYLARRGEDGESAAATNTDTSRVALKDVKSIGCGAYHAMVSVVGDVVYACGLNNYGQLGTGNTENAFYLQHISALDGKRIVMLRGGMHHTLALSSTGELFAFGRGDSSQLGSTEVAMNKAGDFSVVPVKPSLPAKTVVVAVACGGNHNLVLTDKNEVYSWGYGEMLALGHGDEKDEKLPKKLNFSKAKIQNISITQVAGGGQHSAIIGEVVTM